MSKADPLLHVVLDANVLAAALSPKLSKNNVVPERSASIVNAVVQHGWLPMRLYTPSMCLAEVQCVLDKFRYCDWSGDVKGDKTRRLTKKEYLSCSSRLEEIAKSRRIHRLDVAPDHLKIVPLVSRVNQRYQYRRRRKPSDTSSKAKKSLPSPMGAVDCLLVSLSLELAARVDSDSVVVVTTDTRLADVVERCRSLAADKAHALELATLASHAGFQWKPEMYPRCLHIGKCSDSDLASTFGGWPLPKIPIRQVSINELPDQHLAELYRLGTAQRSESGVGPDSLPYSPELDALQMTFACATGIYLRRAEIARRLLSWRKNPASRPKASRP